MRRMHSRGARIDPATDGRTVVETRHDRRALVADAGMGPLSLISVVAGTLVAFGAFVVFLAIAGGIAASIGVDDLKLGSRDFRELSVGGGIAVAAVMLLSWLFGGYVAGRMARRSGVLHGLASLLLGGLAAAGLAAWVVHAGGTERVIDGVRSVGLPTTADQWRDVGTLAGIMAVAAALIGSLGGGLMGERWHTKLVSRALDPAVGPEGRIRESADNADVRAAEAHDAAEGRVRRARAARVVDVRHPEEVRGDNRMTDADTAAAAGYPSLREETNA